MATSAADISITLPGTLKETSGRWWLGHESLTEEQLDAMSPQAWSRYLRRWVNSAAPN